MPAVAAGMLTLPLLAGGTAARAAGPGYTVVPLTFTVTVPNESVGGSGDQTCSIVGDLYKPADASPTHRVPAILTTNGFGGSKDDQADLGRFAAAHGYAVLSYSGLGFGGSGCKISLDDPSYDGRAGSRLVSFLGGQAGIAKDAGGRDYTVDFVRHDATAHDGVHHAHDPRVGMIGGSYGGQIQFAVAGIDPRVDTIVPIITWNDLSYSLAPNNTAFAYGVTYRSSAPGTEKVDWVSAFFGLGIVDGLEGAQVDPSRLVGCPNFLTEACVAKAELDAGGFATQDVIDFARHASVESYVQHIRIPTLLMQGEADTLFNLNESVATYDALRRQGTPVKLVWQSWGHSNGTAAKGEFSQGAGALQTYEGQRVFAWFDHYLRGAKVSTGPGFAFFRDWVPFSATGPDTVQYGTAASYPAGTTRTLYLSGSSALVPTRAAVKSGSASYTNVGGGVPTSYSETSAVQGSQVPDETTPPRDAPGTFAAWSSKPLRSPVDVAGLPVARVHISAPTTSSAAPADMLQLFAKIYDIAPDGSVDLVHRLIAPVRVPDATKPVTITLPGIVHRFATGHRIELVLAATDAAYKNAYPVQPVTVSTSAKSPGSLTLPVLSGAATDAALRSPAPRPAKPVAHRSTAARATGSATLATTGGSPLLPVLAVVATVMGLVSARVRRRRPAARGR
ncbi:MAG TPA: CocE/NonD family hydrolase [Mycobacteriales bacterium]|nr:CocE/NonD family hydrolase [Mycobacteriales bacterium]